MSVATVSMVLLATLLGACSTMGQITVKDHQAKTGERVMAGQAKPKQAYACEQISSARTCRVPGANATSSNHSE